jgi:hypothetical protein
VQSWTSCACMERIGACQESSIFGALICCQVYWKESVSAVAFFLHGNTSWLLPRYGKSKIFISFGAALFFLMILSSVQCLADLERNLS